MKCRGIDLDSGRVLIGCEGHYWEHPLKGISAEKAARCAREEDTWSAMMTLGFMVFEQWPTVPAVWRDIPVVETWQGYLMFLVKPVSRHYGVDDEAVLKSFMSHYMPSIVTSEKHMVEGDPGGIHTPNVGQ